MHRRIFISAWWPASIFAKGPANPTALSLLRQGGLVLVFRHAVAPGTFDPPQFKLGECSTQRNLNDEGRAQAGRIGEWFKQQQMVPARVRSSPWCRCVETATLAFGHAESWAALGSTRGQSEATNQASLQALQRGIRAATRQRAGFEVWITHQFVLTDLVGVAAAAGEGLLLRAAPTGLPELVARLPAF